MGNRSSRRLALRKQNGLESEQAWEGELIEKQFSAEPKPFDGVPQRDTRFPTLTTWA